jgi:hypothetical protein
VLDVEDARAAAAPAARIESSSRTTAAASSIARLRRSKGGPRSPLRSAIDAKC